MLFERAWLRAISALSLLVPAADAFSLLPRYGPEVIAPKFMIISMFTPEAEVWYGIPEFDLLAHNITVPGLSPLFPQVHCTKSGDICQVVTGESEINAGCTITSLLLSPKFDLKLTYFMIGGIAGINPHQGTLADVAFSRYAIQVALQYEFDAREIPTNFSTGYVPQGALDPTGYPQLIYGTEVFEVNTALRNLAVGFASKAKLNDSSAAVAYRKRYHIANFASSPPSVRKCDTATSDAYFSGTLLGEAFSNYTKLITNGTGVYCMTAQEDNATLEAMVRAAVHKLVDFSRVIVMRTASDFDRPYAGEADTTNLLYADQGGFDPAIQNIYLAGREVIAGIVNGWDKTFKKGIKAPNYIGDIFGTLGGKPDFGLPSAFIGDQVMAKRSHRSHRPSMVNT
ncbi:MAG: hypothetical protein M1828_003921 [Chrysothrix sp. TS-e1954]|nr:MAG: hypothetical protein M1828_003921 [Chrysothrix sp. TS-e1954]